MLARFFSNYGILVVLAALCTFLSAWTITEQHPKGSAAAEQVAARIIAETKAGASVAIVARDDLADFDFVHTLQDRLDAANRVVAVRVNGNPRDAALALRHTLSNGVHVDVIAVTAEAADWSIYDQFPTLARIGPASYHASSFLTTSNLLNIADQISVIAIIAIGMTMVIVAGGIDLSVGSLLALSAVLSAWLIRVQFGGASAVALGMFFACAVGIGACAVLGAGTGLLVTFFRVPAFIVTLGVMLLVRGSAEKLTEGQTEHAVPFEFTGLGRGWLFGLLPNAVVLMLVLYVIAHFLMTRTVLGRYIYAVGGNAEAARLSGVPVRRVIVFVYVLSAALAGLGGVITASQLQGGSPNWGFTYELTVIAAVVVGGTSLSGGEGTIFGTLIGAFVIAVIQNGMNLLGLRSWDQQIVLGVVIILAVLFDRIKHTGWLRSRSV